jgi:hypothetical protein
LFSAFTKSRQRIHKVSDDVQRIEDAKRAKPFGITRAINPTNPLGREVRRYLPIHRSHEEEKQINEEIWQGYSFRYGQVDDSLHKFPLPVFKARHELSW